MVVHDVEAINQNSQFSYRKSRKLGLLMGLMNVNSATYMKKRTAKTELLVKTYFNFLNCV